jgi:hypothetical protein
MRNRYLKISSAVIRSLFALLACVAVQGVGLAQQGQPPAELLFARGEQLLYKAELNRGMLRGLDVGELRFSAKVATDKDDGRVLNLIGEAVSKGLLIRLTGAHFQFHVESTADANPFEVLRTRSSYRDKRGTTNTELTFNHAAGKAEWTESKENQPANAKNLEFKAPVTDVLTLIYFVRTRNLKPGHKFDVMMIDAGRVYRCEVNVLAGKKIATPIGRVNTLRIEPAIFDGSREVRARGSLIVWMTDDARHLPVKAQVKAPIGNIDINLKRITYREPAIARN